MLIEENYTEEGGGEMKLKKKVLHLQHFYNKS